MCKNSLHKRNAKLGRGCGCTIQYSNKVLILELSCIKIFYYIFYYTRFDDVTINFSLASSAISKFSLYKTWTLVSREQVISSHVLGYSKKIRRARCCLNSVQANFGLSTVFSTDNHETLNTVSKFNVSTVTKLLDLSLLVLYVPTD